MRGRWVRRIRGVIVVDLVGSDAFLPGSQIDVRPVRDFDVYIGKTMDFRVVKINHPSENVVVSHKVLVEEEMAGQRKAIIESLRHIPVHIRTLPDWGDLASGRVTIQDFKELDIEDLLGRDPVPPNTDLLARNLAGKVVLVTGAGGSIGSELCRQIVAERPRQLLLLEHSEYNLYSIDQELQRLCTVHSFAVELVPLLGSVTNLGRLHEVCRLYHPQTVYLSLIHISEPTRPY